MTSCTTAWWLKEILKMSGIDVTLFTAHSTRGASSSAAADSGKHKACAQEVLLSP